MDRKHTSPQNGQNWGRKNAITAQDDCSRLPLGYPQNPTEELYKVISKGQSGAMVSSGFGAVKLNEFLRSYGTLYLARGASTGAGL